MRVLDLFAGCGGLSLGFQTAGFDIAEHVEYDKRAYESATSNVAPSDAENGCRDIHDFDPIGREYDVVIGGPPCQAYSLAGRGKLASLAGIGNAHYIDDRGELYLRFLDVVEASLPRAVLIENVPEILTYRHDAIPEEICRKLGRLGFHCSYTILNAAEFGVPQYRERFILIAIRKDAGDRPEFPMPTHRLTVGRNTFRARMEKYSQKHASKFAVPAPKQDDYDSLPQAVTVFEALADLPVISTLGVVKWRYALHEQLPYSSPAVSPYGHLMRTWPGFKKNLPTVSANTAREVIRDFPIFARMAEGAKYPDAYAIAQVILKEKFREYELLHGVQPGQDTMEKLRKETVPPYDPTKFHDKWRKLDRNAPSHTVVAHLSVDTYSHIHYDSTQARGITVREAARLQSFPDGFQFFGSIGDAYKQIGNAVPPLLAFHLASAIKKKLSE